MPHRRMPLGFQDRPYYRQPPDHRGHGGPTIGLPRVSPVVKYLLIINIAVFVCQFIFRGWLEEFFAATGTPPVAAFQLWRLITFQFLHSTALLRHILFNMLGLFFLGPILERSWGSKRFLTFYLISGAVGGAVYVLAALFGAFGGHLIGASGGVLALLVACAVLFPHFRVILLIFPVPIRFAAVLFTALYAFNVLRDGFNAGGDLCHLGGMATGFIWVMARPYLTRARQTHHTAARQRHHQSLAALQAEVDRILAKVHQQGIQSLTPREKETLRQATEQQKRPFS